MTLLEKYIIARWAYAIGEDIGVGDIEYRQIEEELKKTIPDNEYLNRSWSDDPCPIELLKVHDMMHLYRNIKFDHMSESIPSINSWEHLKQLYASLNGRARLSFKLDGFNIQVNYYNGKPISAETRGRTGNSLNANVIMRIVPQKIPYKGKVKITGETVIPNKLWEAFKTETGTTSQRSAVSTAMARELTEYITFVAFKIQSDTEQITRDQYDVLKDCGFATPQFMIVNNYVQLESAIKRLGKTNRVYAYPTDGLVIDTPNGQMAIRVGEWEEKSLESYVVSYEENIGIYNNPMNVKIKPIEYDGATRREVSVTNLQYIIDNDLQIGSPIAFDIRSKTTAVLNTIRTNQLHEQWAGKYEEFRKSIDAVAVV